MKHVSPAVNKKVIEELEKRVTALRTKLAATKTVRNGDEFIQYKVEKSQARFERIRNPNGSDRGRGEFFLLLNVTARTETVYVPLSIASSKKPTGFVYHIEGTAKGLISTTDISCRGDGITKVTLGTLLYVKIPKGRTARFRMLIEMRGNVGKQYAIVINRINYKLHPRDARYKRFDTEIRSKTLTFH